MMSPIRGWPVEALRAREIYRRLAQRHQVTLITGLFPGAQREEEIDGIHFVRVGSDRNYARSRLAYCHAAVDQLEADVMGCLDQRILWVRSAPCSWLHPSRRRALFPALYGATCLG